MDKTDRILYIVSSIRRDAYRFIEDELEKRGISGLSYTHGAILYALLDCEGVMRLSDIARLINRKKSTVTVLVNRLEEMNFLQKKKSTSDSRATCVTITEEGKKLKSIFDDISRSLKSRAFENISGPKQKLLVEILDQVENNFTQYREGN